MNRAILWNTSAERAAALRRWAPVALVVVAALLLGLGGETLREWGRFEREGLAGGEIWRLVTGHLVHLGWGHVWLNLIALLLMAGLFDDSMRAGDWVLAGLLGAGAIDAGLFLFHEDVQWYVGLSGVLHGFMVVGGVALTRSGPPPIGYVLLAGLVGKLVWEQIAGPLPFSESTSGGPVVVAAHLYGALGGVAALAWQLTRRTTG